MTTLVVLQPSYLPWLGFFDQMQRSDIFVLYDDVAFDKNGWRNRNRIKSADGPVWLTVPVLSKGRGGQRINETAIDNRSPWARKHLKAISQAYARAPFLGNYYRELGDLLGRPWERLVDLDVALIELICRWLGLARPLFRSSLLGVTGERSTRLVNLCLHFSADRYLSGNAAKDYLDTALFERRGIDVDWQDYIHPVYRQQHGEFIANLSILDLLFNVGDDSLRTLSNRRSLIERGTSPG